MKPRKLELGDRNIIGKRVTEARLAQGMKQVELLANCSLPGLISAYPRCLYWKVRNARYQILS